MKLAVWYWILKREKTAAFFLYRVTCVKLSGTINVYSVYTWCVLIVHTSYACAC